jgi:hemolysin activation/secretion protein
LGYQAGLALGRNLHFSSPGSVDYFVRGFGQMSLGYGGGLSGNYKASVTSYFVGQDPNEMTVSATALHFWRVMPNQTLLGRVTTTIGSHWAPSSQLTLGSFSGLRGYRSNEFAGQRLLVVNLEHRMFSLMSLWFFKLGTSFFFDSGVVWNQGEGFGHQPFHSSVGLGLQIESGKNLGNGIFRFDVAYNMDQRRIALVLSADHIFRAFSNMEFIPPVPGAEQDQRSRY